MFQMQYQNKSNALKYRSEDVDLLVKQMMPLVSQAEREFTRGVAIYGAGFVGSWAAQYLRSIGAIVNHFIDSDPQKNGTKIHGIPVVLPTTYSPFEMGRVYMTSVVSSFLSRLRKSEARNTAIIAWATLMNNTLVYGRFEAIALDVHCKPP